MELEIETKIKNYRASHDRMMLETTLTEMEEIWKPFQNATSENPVNADEFLSALNLDCLQDFFKKLYRRDPDYPVEAMVKAVMFMDLKKMKFYPELVRFLMSNPTVALRLGFLKEEGEVCIPSKQNFWHFCNIRLKDQWDTVFTLMRDEIAATAKTLGFTIGEKTLEDAMPLQSLKGDIEAEYNAHYKIKGYKIDSVTDQNKFVPVSIKVTPINADEAKNLIPHISAMNQLGIQVVQHTIDGGYADYEMIGWMGIHGIQGCYKIHNNWVFNANGDEQYIQALYQKHWKDPEFTPYAPLPDILRFLFRKGYAEEVGAFYRNQSKIKNTGSTNIKGYLLIQVQYQDPRSGTWVLDNDTINETSPRTINIGSQLALDTIFNGKIRASNLQHGTGTYRIYTSFRDSTGKILKTNSGAELKAWWQFSKT